MDDKWLSADNNLQSANLLAKLRNDIQSDEDIAVKSAFLLHLLEVIKQFKYFTFYTNISI